MRKGGRLLVMVFLAGLGGAVVPNRAAAQMNTPQIVTLGGGLSSQKWEGSAESVTSWVITARFDGAFGPYVVFEPGFAFVHTKSQFGSRNLLLPEISVQLQGYVGSVRPYFGGGIGFSNTTSGPNMSEFTMHLATGLRVHLVGPWGLRLEARGRTIDPFKSRTLDITAGIMRVIPTAF